jgi:hypothetical protein
MSPQLPLGVPWTRPADGDVFWSKNFDVAALKGDWVPLLPPSPLPIRMPRHAPVKVPKPFSVRQDPEAYLIRAYLPLQKFARWARFESSPKTSKKYRRVVRNLARAIYCKPTPTLDAEAILYSHRDDGGAR